MILGPTRLRYVNMLLAIILIIAIGSINSCKSDDSMPDMTDEQVIEDPIDDEASLDFPSDFEMTISDISHDSAVVSWTSAATSNTGEVLYSIFLNDELLTENLEELSYTLSDLVFNTFYTVRVSAINSLGESLQIREFETPYPAESTLLLQQLNISEVDYYTFMYNDNNKIVTVLSEGTDPAYDLDIHYEYLVDGNLRKVVLFGLGYFQDSKFSYVDGEVFEIKNSRDDGDALSFITHTFTAETTMDYELLACPYMCETTLASVTVMFDSENRLTFYEWTNNDDPTDTFFYTFEYTDGNLTKVTDVGANVWEFSFDNKISFLTYSSYYPEDFLEYSGFLFSLKNNLHRDMKLIPFINSFKNTNNPVSFSYNGTIYRTIEYEYNSLDYPTEVVQTNEGVEQPPISLSYRLAN